jgi:cytidylate kinase-like protein
VPHQAICISRSTGAEGEAVGRAVAERLGFRYVDDEVIEEAAKSAGVDRELVADAEQRKPLAVRILAHIGEQSPETLALLPATGPESLPREEDLRLLIIDVLRSLADEGSVVIVAHAASFALAKRDVLRVLVTASTETRTERVAKARAVDSRTAAKTVKRDDDERADYLKRFYRVDRELPTHFDLVINTDVLTPEKAADVVLSALD